MLLLIPCFAVPAFSLLSFVLLIFQSFYVIITPSY
jgi:hypothetical protein